MMNVSLNIPEVLHSRIIKFSKVAKLTTEEFMLLAIAEKIAAVKHSEWSAGRGEADQDDPCGTT